MTRAVSEAERNVKVVLRRQGDLITRAQAFSTGLTPGALRRRLRPGGPWKVVLPGIYLSHGGELTGGQREIAAVLYAGRGCVITGSSALLRMGVRAPLSETVDVLIPAASRRSSTGFVRVLRTKRMPEEPWQLDGMRWAPAARAVADAARCERNVRDVRALVADAVQRQTCTVQQLAAELRAGPKQGSGALRAALEEVADGVASVAEGDLRKLIKSSGLPEPLYNPRLFVGDVFLAKPDAWWAEAGVAVEVDSMQWHLSPDGLERTQARHAAISSHGILLLHFAPRRIRADGASVVARIRATLEEGKRRPPLAIRTVPAR
jgi:hypothetical protein